MKDGSPDRSLSAARARQAAAWASAWAQELGTGALSLPRGVDPRTMARALARMTVSGLEAEAHAEAAGGDIGHLLAQNRLTSPESLRRAVWLLGTAAPRLSPDSGSALALLQSAVVGTHASDVREILLEHQEAIHQASLSARVDAERALFASEARFRAVFSEAAIGIGIGDLQGQILDVNRALEDMLGYSVDEFRARRVDEFAHPDDVEEIWQGYADVIAGRTDAFRTEKRYRHRDGRTIWTHLTLSLIRARDGSPTYQVAMMEDISERHALTQELVHAATHDALTGLPNRESFLQRLNSVLAAGKAEGTVGVCFLDLDGFKMVNDIWGHSIGDQVLVTVAQRLSAVAAAHDAWLARLAGDEFVTLSTGRPSAQDQVALGEALLAGLDQSIDIVPGEALAVAASVGVVALPADVTTAHELMSAADLALHTAKESGKGRVVVHDQDRTDSQITRFGIAMSLPGVVERGELGVDYQPMVNLRDGSLHGVEALLRWTHPRLGDVPADLFVRVAEESTSILGLGRWILRKACHDVRDHDWPVVAVNISARQLHNPGIVDDVEQALAQARIPPHRLRLEMTESILMLTDQPGPLTVLQALADRGIGIVLDDFGTGYANLAALRRLPLQGIKLAGPFVHTMLEDSPDTTGVHFLATIVDLAHTLDLTVTAEGIENDAQHEQIRGIGCDIAQGWFYGRPAALA